MAWKLSPVLNFLPFYEFILRLKLFNLKFLSNTGAWLKREFFVILPTISVIHINKTLSISTYEKRLDKIFWWIFVLTQTFPFCQQTIFHSPHFNTTWAIGKDKCVRILCIPCKSCNFVGFGSYLKMISKFCFVKPSSKKLTWSHFNLRFCPYQMNIPGRIHIANIYIMLSVG